VDVVALIFCTTAAEADATSSRVRSHYRSLRHRDVDGNAPHLVVSRVLRRWTGARTAEPGVSNGDFTRATA